MRFVILFISALGFIFSSCGSEGGMGGEKTLKTPNGFDYIHHIANDGEKGTAGQYAYFHVYIKTNDSLTYSSREQGQGTMPKIAIPDLTNNSQQRPSPVTDVLTLMAEGDSITVFQPQDTTRNSPVAGKKIAYDVVLYDLKSAEEYRADYEKERKEQEAKRAVVIARVPEVKKMVEEQAELYKSGQLDSKITTLPSGLKILIHEQGTGAEIKPKERVKVHYYGALTDGSMFDNSFQRGTPFEFSVGVGQVIRGWDEGVPNLNKGGKATLFIPSELGYGAAGSPPKIPGGSELIFYVEAME